MTHWLSSLMCHHEGWAIPVIFFLAFSESLVFLSLILPATAIMLALGLLIGNHSIAFWSSWAAAAIGAFLGDWLSYWIGYRYQNRVINIWPLSRNPQLLKRAHIFFERWGVLGIFIARFFGPFRAIGPLIGGICGMPQAYFQVANITSAMIWAFGILAPGALGAKWLNQ